jgi:hypothetical protein
VNNFEQTKSPAHHDGGQACRGRQWRLLVDTEAGSCSTSYVQAGAFNLATSMDLPHNIECSKID